MSKRHDLIITISDSGEVTVKAEGINGPECVKETDFLIDEQDLVVSQEFTSEYYKEDDAAVSVEHTE